MRTTLVIEDSLYRRAKAKAAMEGTTVTRLVERALAADLELASSAAPKPRKPEWLTISEGVPRSGKWAQEIRRIDARVEQAFGQVGSEDLQSPAQAQASWTRATSRKNKTKP